MVERGYEVFAVYLSKGGSRYSVEGTKELWLGYEKYRLHGVKIIKLLGLLMAYLRFKKLLIKIRPNIVHACSVPTCGFITALSDFHPFLLMPMGSDVLLVPKKSLLIRKITKFTIKRADMITCDAETVKREIIQLSGYPPEKIVVFARGIDLSLFKPNISLGLNLRKRLDIEGKKVIIMNRSFKPIYGIEYFLRALPMVWEKFPVFMSC
jgi:glycosyltransferase involved in cell wall biosynthesis